MWSLFNLQSQNNQLFDYEIVKIQLMELALITNCSISGMMLVIVAVHCNLF